MDRVSAGQNAAGRYYALDVLRGLASLVIVVFHYPHFFRGPGDFAFDPASPQYITQNLPFFSVLGSVYVHGWKAVQLFFVLSGFVFFALYHRKVYERIVKARKFSVLRFSRLYPLHLATLLLVAALQAISSSQLGGFLFYRYNDVKHFVLNLFLATDWGFTVGESFNGPAWSVSVEVLLYACFFGLSRVMRFSLIRCVIVAALAMALWKVDYQISTALSCFFAGGGMFFLTERFQADIQTAWIRLLVALGILASAVLAYALIPEGHFLSRRVLFFVVFPAVVLSLATLDRSFHPRLKSVRWIGDITYSTYMLHVPVQLSAILLLSWLGLKPDFYSHWILILYVLVVIVLSVLSYRYFELPARSWLRARAS